MSQPAAVLDITVTLAQVTYLSQLNFRLFDLVISLESSSPPRSIVRGVVQTSAIISSAPRNNDRLQQWNIAISQRSKPYQMQMLTGQCMD